MALKWPITCVTVVVGRADGDMGRHGKISICAINVFHDVAVIDGPADAKQS